jgi:hypothetical protein
VRHYDRTDARHDPSSPVNGKEMAANLARHYRPLESSSILIHRSKLYKVRYLSATGALTVFSDEHTRTGQRLVAIGPM